VGWITSGRTLLIAAGGPEAHIRLRHAQLFDWARIIVVQPAPLPAIIEAADGDPRVSVAVRGVTEDDVRGAHLVMEDTGSLPTALRIASWCRQHRTPLNAMDKPELCDVHYLSLVAREGLVVAIGTGGEAPVLSSLLRRRLSVFLGPGWDAAARLLGAARRRMAPGKARMNALRNLCRQPELLRCIEQNDVEGIRGLINHASAQTLD
jgi:uroporphyrin-III C-methyltransferase/precorrin-2 dehydrogenase/sirohydrochlorin ferrochelatase